MAIAQLLEQTPLVLYVAAALLGLCVGSFLNVVVHRLPQRLEHDWAEQCRELLGTAAPAGQAAPPPSIVYSRSRCPSCGHSIRAIENIPLVSFALLRGRCAGCGSPISWRYPAVEALTAALSVLTVAHFGMSWQAAAALILTWMLIALSFIDIDRQILPDAITLPGVWLGLIVNLFGTFTDLHAAVIGAVAGYLSLWLVYHAFRLITGKEGMGFGDFKLLAVFGAWLGWQALPVVVLLSALAGSVIGLAQIVSGRRGREQPLPYGPYLAVAGWIAMLWGSDLIAGYVRLAGLGA